MEACSIQTVTRNGSSFRIKVSKSTRMGTYFVEQSAEIEMYYVKWRDLSYIHCSWETDADLTQLEGIHIRQKIQVCYFFNSISVVHFKNILISLFLTINPNHHFERCSWIEIFPVGRRYTHWAECIRRGYPLQPRLSRSRSNSCYSNCPRRSKQRNSIWGRWRFGYAANWRGVRPAWHVGEGVFGEMEVVTVRRGIVGSVFGLSE